MTLPCRSTLCFVLSVTAGTFPRKQRLIQRQGASRTNYQKFVLHAFPGLDGYVPWKKNKVILMLRFWVTVTYSIRITLDERGHSYQRK